MDSLFEILAQLDENERENFTSWFSKLSQKERTAVASTLADADLEKVRVLLSVPEQSRISLFPVDKTAWEEFDESFKSKAEEAKHKADENWAELRARHPLRKGRKRTLLQWLNPFAK